MIDIQKIAREAGIHIYPEYTAAFTRFAALIREAMIAELVAGSGEPVAWAMKDAAGNVVDTITEDDRQRSMSRWADCYPHPLLLRDQLAGAVLRERERCAQIAEDFPHDQLGCLDEVAEAIRSRE